MGTGRGVKTVWVWGVVIVGLPLAVYGRTLCPSIFAGDSGELVTGAYCLGIVHPPGYPLYCLVGRITALLPGGSVALRLNLFSALCAALSAGLLFWLTAAVVRKLMPAQTENKVPRRVSFVWPAALLAGFLCAFSRTLWSQAVVAEVYALHLFLVLLCLALLARWAEGGGWRYLCAFAFVLGLSLAHHPTAALAAPAFLLFLAWHGRRLFENRRVVLILVGFIVLGFSVVLYLPFRSLAQPPLQWGDPSTPGAMVAHLTRASYGRLSNMPFSWRLFGSQVSMFLRLLAGQFGPVLLGIGLLGLVALFHGVRDWFAISLCLFLLGGLGVILLLNFSVAPKEIYLVQVFFIPTFAMVALWTGIGAGWLAQRLAAVAALFSAGLAGHLAWTLKIVLPMLAVIPLWVNFPANDRSGQFLVADLGENILASLEPGAVLFTSMDTPTFSLAHARIVGGLRPDVSLSHNSRADIFRHLDPPPVPMNPEVRPVYGITPGDLPKIPSWTPHQVGMVYQLRRAPMETDDLVAIWDGYRIRDAGTGRHQHDFFINELVRNLAAARGNLAQELARRGRFQRAIEEGQGALAMDSTFFGTHLSLGNIYFQMGLHERAMATYERALLRAPQNVDVINNLALAHLREGHAGQAIRLYQRSIDLEPQLAKTHNDLGLAYKTAGRYVEAVQEYHRAISLDPKYADPVRNLGVIYAYHLVDMEQAMVLWRQYLDLNPQDPEVERISAEIERLQNLIGDGNSDVHTHPERSSKP